MSPTSSRNSVPPCAYSKRPTRSVWASVYAPRTWPNNSLSSRCSLSAAQLSATNGFFLRGLFWCSAWANKFLARAGLAGNQHAGIGRGQSFKPFDDDLHFLTGVDNAFEAEAFIQALLQIHVFQLQPHRVGRLGRHGSQPIGRQRFFQEVERPLLHRLDGLRHRTVSRHDNDFAVGQRLLGTPQNLLAVDFVHHQIRDHDVE